mmetsp:Transcript_28113/g.71284  ORF Transcript_28113/g.71284 Transcript_28113/m.71284 type:complete len:202 (-) Transcript_28113:219-824(-)
MCTASAGRGSSGTSEGQRQRVCSHGDDRCNVDFCCQETQRVPRALRHAGFGAAQIDGITQKRWWYNFCFCFCDEQLRPRRGCDRGERFPVRRKGAARRGSQGVHEHEQAAVDGGQRRLLRRFQQCLRRERRGGRAALRAEATFEAGSTFQEYVLREPAGSCIWKRRNRNRRERKRSFGAAVHLLRQRGAEIRTAAAGEEIY